jgi:hypothetical protein
MIFSGGTRGSRLAVLFRPLLAAESYIITLQLAIYVEPAWCLPSTSEVHRMHNEDPFGATVHLLGLVEGKK